VRECPSDSTAVIWGRETDEMLRGTSIIRAEDGFIRSVGLGADLVRPLSLTFDDAGIHFDPQRPSRLETLLATTDFNEALLQRARDLRRRIVATGITKYNLHEQPWLRPSVGARIILVPGQVEDDASVRWGGGGIKSNLDLVEAVRAGNPDAWIIYKPHPDCSA